MVAPPRFERIALVGIGLIGSSISHACRRAGLADHIAVHTRSPRTLEQAEALELGDSYHGDITEAVKGADLVVVSVPVGAFEAVAKQVGPHLKPGAILSDVGSVKQSVIDQVRPHLPEGVHFVPAHPLAGTEHSGPEAGFAELFDGRWLIITPLDGTPEEPVARLEAFWRALGSKTTRMDVSHHDFILGITSHLPHLIAYTIVGTAADLEDELQREVIQFSASGFRDFTRIAASDPVMWRDVFLHNKEAVLGILERFHKDLEELEDAIRSGDGETLHREFTRTRGIRRAIIEAKQA
ncbi:MAG: prephenate/arogenate dehydrogenase family protein [Alphaproteobacteria bacterium]|nr:prephenate/arogenate dehydrogenase family protein [Alphaproteobacteria bacterium]